MAAESVLRGEVSCDQVNARNKVTWRVAGEDTGEVVDLSVTPAGSTLDQLQSLIVNSPGFPVGVQTVPMGATSASASLTVHWWGAPGSTITGSVTFSPRCGRSQPWATFTPQCDHVSTLITMGNAASAPGPAELTVRKNRDSGPSVVGVYFVMPGQQRTLTIGEPALLEVIQFDTAHIGTDFYVTNFSTPPNPDCDGGAPIRPEVPGQQPAGGTGSAPMSTATADPTMTATPTATSSPSASDGAVVAVQTKEATPAAIDAPEPGRSFAAAGWTVAGMAVLIAVGLVAWLRLRRPTAPTASSTGE